MAEPEHNVGVREFRENMSMYIAQAKAGTPVTIMSHGKPVAELHAPTGRAVRPKPRYGGLKGKMWVSDDWEEWDEATLAAFEAPIDPIALIDFDKPQGQ
jgi:antitoxin (DNA-binding transcriptional repressor) of toxin-antitoxin stability system